MSTDFYSLPFEVQVALGCGYLGFATAYAGIAYKLRATDIIFRSLAFGLVALTAFRLFLPISPHFTVAIGVTAVTTVISGAIWRVFGARLVVRILHELGVHKDDYFSDTWTALIQQKDLRVGQISVHTKDGRVLYMNANKYPDAHLGGLYLGGDGSIVMVVEEEELPDGTEETRTGIIDPDWGTRVTYIPAGEISRVNLR